MLKTLSIVEVEGNFLNIIKGTYKNLNDYLRRKVFQNQEQDYSELRILRRVTLKSAPVLLKTE